MLFQVLFQFQTGAIRSPSILKILTLSGQFQFQTGAIRSSYSRNRKLLEQRSFNSKLVRLEGKTHRSRRRASRSFNSKLVRLEGQMRKPGATPVRSFNSKLVRLEVNPQQNKPASLLQEFQFQTGAIRSETIRVISFSNMLFQFQTGAIRSSDGDAVQITKNEFQFQTGAIRSWEQMELDGLKKQCFNSKLVRLEVI